MSADSRAVAHFLDEVPGDPSALVIEGEAGIGKTTLWLVALNQARERGFRILSTRGAEAESMLAHASLADLIGGVDESTLSALPPPQRVALERVLLRSEDDGGVTDQRAVAAGFLTIVKGLSDTAPTLLAVDDLQWLDPATRQILAITARRLPARAAIVATVRTDHGMDAVTWLQLRRPDAISRITVTPMTFGALRALLSERLGRKFSRPALVRIHEISGGNPFYAIELARALPSNSGYAEPLPRTLSELVRARIDGLDTAVHEALLVASCVPAPTVELVARATGGDLGGTKKLLEHAANRGIFEVDHGRIHFSHPLLARGVYTSAGPARRRAVHQRLAEVVVEPELQARHLALGAVTADTRTLRALEAAIDAATIRGAPATAAELLELTIALFGDAPERRMLLAIHRFNEGDAARARALLEGIVAESAPANLRASALSTLSVMSMLQGSLLEADELLERALRIVGEDIETRSRALVFHSWNQLHIGRLAAAETNIEMAVADAERLRRPELLSQALGMYAVVHFLLGNGADFETLSRAMALEDQTTISVMFRPSVQNAMVLAWTGQHEPARHAFGDIRRTCIDRGEESELVFVEFHSVLNEIWLGRFAAADRLADETFDRAVLSGGELPVAVALTMRALTAAYTGRDEEARRLVLDAMGPIRECGSDLLLGWTAATLGFLELSLGNHEASVGALEPLLDRLRSAPDGTELFSAWFVPDIVEALVQLGRLQEAESLVELLECNGRRLDRAWMLAVGGRCRAMLLAARGDVAAAAAAAEFAMAFHDRLAMPFERARTQLLLGRLERRRRRRGIARATLGEALGTFETLGTPLWADQVRAELDRTKAKPTTSALTVAEQRVAELAAAGMTNRDVAAALFISPKTVEANLSRIYHKLGIHSRAQLGRHGAHLDR